MGGSKFLVFITIVDTYMIKIHMKIRLHRKTNVTRTINYIFNAHVGLYKGRFNFEGSLQQVIFLLGFLQLNIHLIYKTDELYIKFKNLH
jgi:hypothetical protein